jgi:hypothetical protein
MQHQSTLRILARRSLLTNRRWHFAALVCLCLLLTSFGNAEAVIEGAATVRVPPPTGSVIFVVSGDEPTELSMDAVVIAEGGKLKAPYSADEEASRQRFAKEYFRPEQKYRLTFGGGEAGTVTVTKSDLGCNNIHATVSASTSARLGGAVRALATNSESLGKRTSARRAPTSAERTAVMNLVKKIYTQHGVTAAQYRSLTVTNLTATDLDGDGKYEVVGSFALTTKTKAQRDLFLIAKPQGVGFIADFSKFQAYQPPPEGFLSSIDFVDQLDLDGNGTGEVFAIQGGFDGYGYVIFKKVKGRWRQVYDALGDAC